VIQYGAEVNKTFVGANEFGKSKKKGWL